MASFNEFRNMVLGKGFDIDGYYGNQCWDGYAKYCQYLGYPFAHCGISGYVKDIWNQRATNGMLKYFNEVEVMQPGDVAVFKEVAGWTPWSHIAIYVKDLGGGYGLFLGQNQGAYNGVFNEVKLPYHATFPTAFRPKCFANQSAPKPQIVTKPVDDVLSVGSKVQFKGFLRVEKYNSRNGLIYNGAIGGWISPNICFEDSARDGKQDQYFANTNATFTIKGTYTVGQLKQTGKQWDAYLNELGFWVHVEPLIEVANGR